MWRTSEWRKEKQIRKDRMFQVKMQTTPLMDCRKLEITKFKQNTQKTAPQLHSFFWPPPLHSWESHPPQNESVLALVEILSNLCPENKDIKYTANIMDAHLWVTVLRFCTVLCFPIIRSFYIYGCQVSWVVRHSVY